LPFNVLPVGISGQVQDGCSFGHGAGTPLKLAKWWTRYICPPGGAVCDPFMGSGTMGLAALEYGNDFIGIERMNEPGYFPAAVERMAQKQPRLPEAV
jgi:DNA modification methylase